MNSPAISHQDLEILARAGYKLTPATLAYKRTSGAWIPAKHLLHLSTAISTAITKGGARIAVTMPPRHGKSEFTSINTPVWHLDKYPSKNVILTSYGAELATDFGRQVRDIILGAPPELDVRLKKDSLQVGRFHTTDGGAMFSVGIGGTISGRGGDLLLVDDYVKNAEDSFSKTQRDKAWDWFRSTAFTRLEPGASAIVLGTRWHQEDLVGHLLKEQGDIWTEIRLPAIAEENDPLGRAPGEALWPERYPIETLRKIEEALGSYWFSALYQQKPLSTIRGVVSGDCLITVTELPHPSRLKTIRTWDFASSEEDGDYTAGPKMSLDKETGRIYIQDMYRFRKSPGATELIVKSAADSDSTKVPIWIEQEPGSAGKIVISHYSRNVLSEYSVKGLRPTGPLEVRAGPFLAAVEAGKVCILKGAWNEPLKEEMNTFPGGDHDDQMAALALGCERLGRGNINQVIWGEKTKKSFSADSSIIRGVVW